MCGCYCLRLCVGLSACVSLWFCVLATIDSTLPPALCTRQIILAKVLVGEFTPGDYTMVKPPKMGGAAGDREYDTTSDDPHSPKLIVSRPRCCCTR